MSFYFEMRAAAAARPTIAACFASIIIIIGAAATLAAQSQPAPPRSPAATAPRLGTVAVGSLAQGWSALRDGRPAEALKVCSALLDDPWSSHDAVALCVAAAVQQGGTIAA